MAAIFGKRSYQAKDIHVVVVNLGGKEECNFQASTEDTVGFVKAQIQYSLKGCPVASQRLVAGNSIVTDGETLQKLCTENDPHPRLLLTLVRLPPEIVEWLSGCSEIALGGPPTRVEREVLALFRDAEQTFRECFECVMLAASFNGLALEFACPSLCNDRRIALTAVQQNPEAVQFVSKELQEDVEIVTTALLKCGRALRYVERVQRDYKIASVAVSQDPTAADFVNESLKRSLKFRCLLLRLYFRSSWIARLIRTLCVSIFLCLFLPVMIIVMYLT